MSNTTPTIWMNVTTSALWLRPPVGIVRVERLITAELKKLYGDRLRTCIWNGTRFIETVYTNQIQTSQSTTTDLAKTPRQRDAQALPPILPLLPKRKAIAAFVQASLSLAPKWLQPQFNRFLYWARAYANRIKSNNNIRRIISLFKRKAKISSEHYSESNPEGNHDAGAIFSPGDTLISIGLDWDHPFYKNFYYFRKNKGVKIVTCCYDLIPVLYPQYCVSDVAGVFTSYFLDIADGSDLVLCISKQSERDLNAMLSQTGGARPQTHVFPLGDNALPVSGEEISAEVEAACREPFALFVSTIERRKNHEILYRAYHLLCAQGKRSDLPKLVFVGMQGWGVDSLMKDMELDPLTKGLIIQLNHVSDAELRLLYERAKFCVFPSLYEGWGLPVGEALSLGKAVISSDRGSLPEVGGDLVIYADPWSPRAWADAIHRMSTDDGWREQLESRVKSSYRTRSWTDAAFSIASAVDRFVITPSSI